MKPWEFRDLEPNRSAELMAIYAVDSEIDNYWNGEQARKLDKPTKDKNQVGKNGPPL